MSRLKKFRAKHYKAPQPIPPPKPPRPSISKLRKIYHDLISTDVDQRVETLKKVVHWFEGAIGYVSYFKAWNFKQKRALAEAQKHRLSALRTDKDETKEHAYISAIHCYEKLVRKLYVPKLNSYISKYSKVRSVLEKRKRKYNKKFSGFLETVDSLLQPVNFQRKRISLHVDKLSERYRINSEGNVTFDRKFLDEARRESRKKGMLPGILILLPVLAEAAAMTMERDHDGHRTGRYVIHGSAKAAAWQDMLRNLVNHCMKSNSKIRLIRRQKVTAPSVKTAA